jgi:CDP-diacylglycerol--glycerol-3-phosphate 3-phosphatidyltransferase
MIPFFLLFLLWGEVGIFESWITEGWVAAGRIAALLIFAAAMATDYADGYLARKHNLITNFGRLIDPLADKLIVMAAFVAFVELDQFPAWVVCIVLAREFLVTGLRMIAVEQGLVIQADRWGKNKTIAQMVTIQTTLVVLAVRDTMIWLGQWDLRHPFDKEMDWWMQFSLNVLMGVVVFFTVASGWRYVLGNRHLLRDQ